MIRRIAVHRVWKASDSSWNAMQVVEIEADTHRVCRIYPFAEEIRNTEWWGGVVIVSPVVPLLPESGETFEAYTTRILAAEAESSADDRAYYVTGYSIADRRFGPVSRITLI